MRLKNVPGARKKIEECQYFLSNPSNYKGKFKELFKNNNPIEIEIGMGKGNFIISMAKKYPNRNFIGIEKYDSVLVRACEKLENEKIDNLYLISMDANNILDVFGKEISTIYLNFSDPWPKKRHSNRRLSSKIFLDKYSLISKEEPHIIMKTDNRNLFEYSLITFTQNNYIFNDISLDLHADNEKLVDNVMTEYEQKFSARNQIIYKVDVQKVSDNTM